jgi:hypothetical protein
MPIRWAYWKRVLAGAIFGLYIANLLYFLNPQIDITPGRLALVTIVYGAICGLLFGTLLWGLRWLRVRLFGRPETVGYKPHGFGFVVLAAFAAALLYWMHLTVFRIYLPIGAVRVLAKATNLITATAFALLLLWFAERNAERRTSRILFLAGVALIAVSSFFLYQRRDSYRTEKQSVVVANVGTVAGRRPVIVVAVRNLPYDWILTLAGEGSLPFFDTMKSSAYFARLEPFPTMEPKALWASLATGKLPFRHGVTGRLAYRTPLNRAPGERFLIVPGGVGFTAWGLIPPVTRIGSTLPAGDALPFWTIFERVGLRAAVISWPWLPPRGGVVPEQIAQQPSGDVAQRFNAAGKAKPRVLAAIGGDLSALAALRIAARSSPIAICTLGGFEEAQRAIHIFSNELVPRSAPKGELIRAYAEQIDRMLASLARDYPDHLLVVISPSGPVAPRLPQTPLAVLEGFVDPDDPGADDGFVLIAGPGTQHSERTLSASAVDVVPTLLYGAGLPVGRDMDGRVLTDAFTDELLRRNPLSVVQTYEAQQLVVRR